MICNYSSVLFLCIIFIFRCYIGMSDKLQFLFVSEFNVIKCSAHGYLIVRDWFKLSSSNISCPNHHELFGKHFPDIYNWSEVYMQCFENNKTFFIKSYLTDLLPPSGKKNNKVIKKQSELVIGTINNSILNSEFKAKHMTPPSKLLINQGWIKWPSNNILTLYMTFTKQPIVCRLSINFTMEVKNEECTVEDGIRNLICYYEPTSESKLPVTNVNWAQLDFFINDKIYPPSNWKEKGGYYLDVRLLNNTSTSTTTSTTTIISTSKSAFVPDSTSIKIDTTTLSITSSTVDLIEFSDKETHTSLITSSTSIGTTSLNIVSTNLDHTSTISMTITTTTLPIESTTFDAVADTSTIHNPTESTTFEKVTDTTTILHIILNPSKNTSTVLKPPKKTSTGVGKPSNKSRLPTIPLNEKSSPNNNSSSLSIPFTVLLICLTLFIIGLILFFIFHSQRNRQNDDESLLDRNTSDESFNSVEDESEIDPSSEHEMPTYTKLEPSEIIKSRKGGRVFSQLDPEAL